MNLHGLDDYDDAQEDEVGAMAAIAYPLLAIAATVSCWLIAGWLTGVMQ